MLSLTGPPLGVLDDGKWDEKDVTFQSGEMLVLYTDGVTDACDMDGQFYGAKRLTALVEGQKGKSAKSVHDAIFADLDSYVNGELQFDDTAVIIAKRK